MKTMVVLLSLMIIGSWFNIGVNSQDSDPVPLSVCPPVDGPQAAEAAVFTTNGHTLGSIGIYQCPLAGYELIGQRTRTCVVAGNSSTLVWDGEDTYCRFVCTSRPTCAQNRRNTVPCITHLEVYDLDPVPGHKLAPLFVTSICHQSSLRAGHHFPDLVLPERISIVPRFAANGPVPKKVVYNLFNSDASPYSVFENPASTFGRYNAMRNVQKRQPFWIEGHDNENNALPFKLTPNYANENCSQQLPTWIQVRAAPKAFMQTASLLFQVSSIVSRGVDTGSCTRPAEMPYSYRTRESFPSAAPTSNPTFEPTSEPSSESTVVPTSEPSVVPSSAPTAEPSANPTSEPTSEPSSMPSLEPTGAPSVPAATAKPNAPQFRAKNAARLSNAAFKRGKPVAKSMRMASNNLCCFSDPNVQCPPGVPLCDTVTEAPRTWSHPVLLTPDACCFSDPASPCAAGVPQCPTVSDPAGSSCCFNDPASPCPVGVSLCPEVVLPVMAIPFSNGRSVSVHHEAQCCFEDAANPCPPNVRICPEVGCCKDADAGCGALPPCALRANSMPTASMAVPSAAADCECALLEVCPCRSIAVAPRQVAKGALATEPVQCCDASPCAAGLKLCTRVADVAIIPKQSTLSLPKFAQVHEPETSSDVAKEHTQANVAVDHGQLQ